MTSGFFHSTEKNKCVYWQKNKYIWIFSSVVIIPLIVIFSVIDNHQDIQKPTSLFSTRSLSYFDSSIVDGYSQCEDLKTDIETAARFLVDVQVDKNAKAKFRDEWGYMHWIPRGGVGDLMMSEEVMTMETDSSGGDESSKLPPASNGEDSYGTNNQVDGVDEADLIKSDGDFVYAAYGDQVVIWNAASGTELSRTTLPSTDENGIPLCKGSTTGSTVTEILVDKEIIADPVVIDDYYTDDDDDYYIDDDATNEPCYNTYHWNHKITISSLLIHEQRLVVIASAPFTLNDGDNKDILDGYHATRVFTYDISSIPTDKSPLTLLTRKDIQGSYQTARSIDNNAHIVTKSYVRSWYHLDKYIDPWSERYEGLLENEYRQAAYEFVEPYISSFAEKLTEEILYSQNKDANEIDCTDIAKVAFMLRRNLLNNNDTNSSTDTVLSFTTQGVLNEFLQVHSFDIQEETLANNTITTSSSSVFLPSASYTSNVYSSNTKLVITGNAYREDSNNNWKESTVLLAFDLESGKAIAHSVGEVPGSVLNQFSMDHYKYEDGHDYIRVATTTWAQFAMVDDLWTQTSESSNQVSILKLPSESDSTNMEIVGIANGMGVGERIYAARFVEKVAYVVTFRQVDPFYTLNLTDPVSPQVVGELKIPGFSNYLHPVNEDLILALGQDADLNGIVQGLQIAMFNVSDISNPQQINKYIENGYSSSEAQYDHKAFRYLPQSKLLIVPLTIYQTTEGGYFDGFIVYDVDEEKKFSKLFTISHQDDSAKSCWDNSFLPSRSLVFDGKVTTTKGHTAIASDLTTFQKLWTLNLDADRDENIDECYYWFLD